MKNFGLRTDQKGFSQLLFVLLLTAGIIGGTILVQNRTNFLPKAVAEACNADQIQSCSLLCASDGEIYDNSCFVATSGSPPRCSCRKPSDPASPTTENGSTCEGGHSIGSVWPEYCNPNNNYRTYRKCLPDLTTYYFSEYDPSCNSNIQPSNNVGQPTSNTQQPSTDLAPKATQAPPSDALTCKDESPCIYSTGENQCFLGLCEDKNDCGFNKKCTFQAAIAKECISGTSYTIKNGSNTVSGKPGDKVTCPATQDLGVQPTGTTTASSVEKDGVTIPFGWMGLGERDTDMSKVKEQSKQAFENYDTFSKILKDINTDYRHAEAIEAANKLINNGKDQANACVKS